MDDPPHERDGAAGASDGRLDDVIELETATTSPADVESAGRSCLAILLLTAAIVLLFLLWVVYRSMAGGQ